MFRRRTLAPLMVALLLTLPFGAGYAYAADAPGNDGLGTPEVITDLFGYVAMPDMTAATMLDGEQACTDTESQVMVHSVWYAWTSQQPAVLSIEIDGPQGAVTAGVFGPFDTLPTSIGALPDPTWCIYGTGISNALTEYYAPAGASWLIQLTTVDGFVTPTLNVDQRSPWNNDVAYPLPISYPVFEDAPSMAWTWLEDGEPVCADVEDQGLDQSIWYRMDFDFPTDLGIEINGEPAHSVTAGVYGPFAALPTSVTGLEARSCVYDTGPDSALHERYDPGSYLVQLTTSSQTGVQPSIRFTEEQVTVAPWLAPTSVTVPEGVPIDFAWSWFACSADLAAQAPGAIEQTYAMMRDGEEVMGLSPQDAYGLWSGPEPNGDLAGMCRGRGAQGAQMHWSWFVDNLTAGHYQLDVHVLTTRMLTDGTVGDRGVNRYPAGTSLGEGTIEITVIGS